MAMTEQEREVESVMRQVMSESNLQLYRCEKLVQHRTRPGVMKRCGTPLLTARIPAGSKIVIICKHCKQDNLIFG